MHDKLFFYRALNLWRKTHDKLFFYPAINLCRAPYIKRTTKNPFAVRPKENARQRCLHTAKVSFSVVIMDYNDKRHFFK
jgi:hypothetical protein